MSRSGDGCSVVVSGASEERLDQLLNCERRGILFGPGSSATQSHHPPVSFSPCMSQPGGLWRDADSHLQTYAVSNWDSVTGPVGLLRPAEEQCYTDSV